MKKESRRFDSIFRLDAIFCLAFVILSLTIGVVLIFLNVFLGNNLYLYILVGFIAVSLIICVLMNARILHKVYFLLHDDLYLNSMKNYDLISKGHGGLALYQSKGYAEIDDLNKKVSTVSEAFQHTLILSNASDYSAIPLVYLDKEKGIVDHHTFHCYMDRIVHDSCSYRNCLILAYYEFEPNQSLWDYEKNELYDKLSDMFSSYDGKLFSPTKRNNGYYLYLPRIDSISDIQERCSNLVRMVSLSRENADGAISQLPLHFSIICYPYSNIEDLFADIDFATRMGKIVNLYLPFRNNNMRDISSLVRHEAMNLNFMSKFTSGFINLSISEKEDVKTEVSNLLSQYISYMKIDQAGIIYLNESTNTYRILLEEGDRSFGFSPELEIASSTLYDIDAIKDEDASYYASERAHISPRIAEACDRLGISATFLYVVKDRYNVIHAVIFFNKKDGRMPLDTYMRECMLFISNQMADFYLTAQRRNRLHEEERITSALLKLSGYAMYKVNSKTFQLTGFSTGISDATYHKAKIGCHCYEALYDRESPCEKCPLLTGRKMKSFLHPWNIETSLTLNDTDKEKEDKIMLVQRMEGKDLVFDEPYDRTLLVNSYYTLIQAMKNAYLLSGRGYLLLLKIDNQMELVSRFGGEKTSQAIRTFALRIREFETISNVFFYKPDCLAVLLNDYGQIDAVNECEAIYRLSKESFFEDEKERIRLTYLPINYPQGYPTFADFLRHADDFYFSKKYESGKEFIYFDESDYSRSADPNAFMLSVINEKFTKKDFTVNLQPLLNTSNRKIFGAELLLRLSDEYRKITFNTDNLIKVAAMNGKISLISSALLDYIDELYTQYGAAFFRIYGFKRLSINTDYSYLSDKMLPERIKNLFEKHHLPKGFLAFEINEKEIYDHYDDMKQFIKMVGNLGVTFVCDRYNGEYLSFSRFEDLNITEIKIDRDYTRFIDTDKAKYNMVRSLLMDAKEAGIKVGLIGVENMEQYKIIKDINPDCYLQGYAFFKPLSRQDLVTAVRSSNTAMNIN